jgi:hypothetical protein
VRTLYDVLAVTKDATPEEFKRVYFLRVQLLHPDRHVGASPEVLSEAVRATAEMNDAWAVLRDPVARAAYDMALRGAVAEDDPEPADPPRPHEPKPAPEPDPVRHEPGTQANGEPWWRRFHATRAALVLLVLLVVVPAWVNGHRVGHGSAASQTAPTITTANATSRNTPGPLAVTPVTSASYPGWSEATADRMLNDAANSRDPKWSTCATKLFLSDYLESDVYGMTADTVQANLNRLGQSCRR